MTRPRTGKERAAAERMASMLGATVELMEETLLTLEDDGFIAILPRQPTLDVVAPVLVATSDRAEALAGAAVGEINRLTGRSFRVTPEVTKQAKALIRAKATVELVLAVIRAKHAEWSKNPDMLSYIQPSTLLRLSNFQKYRAALEAGPVKINGQRPTFRQLGED